LEIGFSSLPLSFPLSFSAECGEFSRDFYYCPSKENKEEDVLNKKNVLIHFLTNANKCLCRESKRAKNRA
jgi:hypothetical protein